MKKVVVLRPLCVLAIIISFWLTCAMAGSTTAEGSSSVARAANAAPALADVQPESPEDETLITLGDPITVIGSGVVVSGTTATITAGGSYRASGTLADGMLDVNTTAAVTLTLDGANITHSSGAAINVTNAEKLLVVLASGTSNTLTDGATYSDTDQKATLFSNDSLEITGEGSLSIAGLYKHGVASDDDLVISGGSITINSAVKDGLHANDNITVAGGTLQVVQAGSDGLESEGTLVVGGGVMSLTAASDGIKSADAITITGGTLQANAGVIGIESKSGSILVDDGTLALVAADDGLNGETDITINGGQIYVNATGDGMQSNGTLNINGGLVVALGGSDSPAGGLLCGDGYELSFNGGVVVATGGTNSTPSSSSAQHVLVLGSAPQGSALHIARDDAADKEHPVDVLTFNVNKAYQSLVFTSPELLGSRTYTLLKGGSISGGTEFHGLYTGAAYSGGSAWATFTTTSVVTYVNPSAIYLPLVMQAGGSSAASTATPTTQSSTATPTPTPTAQASTATPTPTATATPATPTDTPTPTATPIQSGETVIHLGDPITVDGSGAVVTGSTVTINAGGSYRATGTLADGAIEVNTTGEVTLTLDGANITHSSGPAINVTNAEKLSLVLATGTINTLIDGATYTNTDLKGTLFSNDTLEISGQGALLVTGRYKHGVVSDDDLIINSGNITIVSVVTDGFHANDNITINDGTIQILQTGSDGFESEGTFDVQGGTLTLTVGDDGLIGQNTVTINGGTIQVTSGVEGIESKNNLIVNDGALTIAVSDDGLNAANDITINGGQIYVTATGDAVDSNGTLNINGGTLVMLGGNAPEGGLDCDQCNIVFNGGTVVATGGANSTPSNNSGQYVVVLGNTTVGSVIHIARDDGADIEHPTDVLTFKISKAYQSMIFTSPTLLGSRTYTLYKDGSVSGGTDFHGLYTGATYSGGSTWTTFTTTSKVTNVGGGGPNPPPGP